MLKNDQIALHNFIILILWLLAKWFSAYKYALYDRTQLFNSSTTSIRFILIQAIQYLLIFFFKILNKSHIISALNLWEENLHKKWTYAATIHCYSLNYLTLSWPYDDAFKNAFHYYCISMFNFNNISELLKKFQKIKTTWITISHKVVSCHHSHKILAMDFFLSEVVHHNNHSKDSNLEITSSMIYI